LLSERHVTKASVKVGLSQPAMSNALSRLRGVFGDELLVRTATGMKPTPRALELIDPLRQLLRQVERVLDSDAGFEPATAQRTFAIRMSDILSCMVLPRLMSVVRTSPGISINILHLPPAQTVDALERDEVDVAISMGLSHSNSIRSVALLRDRMVCVMRKSHPAVKRKTLSFADFIAQRHVKVSMSPTDLRFVDHVLAQKGYERNVVLNVPHWLVVPHILEQSDLVAVMPGLLAGTLVGDGLQMHEVPFRSAPFSWMMYWHRRHDQGKANCWLRDQIQRVCADPT
jgi:DNA-binding transcriptional LysR family regulator